MYNIDIDYKYLCFIELMMACIMSILDIMFAIHF